MNDMTRQTVVAPIPHIESISVRTDVRYPTNPEALDLDLYRSDRFGDSLLPAVMFVTGYPDAGFQQAMGCRFKDMACYRTWSQLLASHGLVAVTYEAENPAQDAQAALSYLHTDAANLGIDADRIGLWSCSGNSPTAVSLLAQPGSKIRCLASLYGYLMDLEGSTVVADAAAQFGFANPTADIELDNIKDKPALLVRAGRDQMPGLNDAADRFVSFALQKNLPLGLLNYPEGDHAFDLTDQSSRSLAAIQQVVDFLVRQLNAEE